METINLTKFPKEILRLLLDKCDKLELKEMVMSLLDELENKDKDNFVIQPQRPTGTEPYIDPAPPITPVWPYPNTPGFPQVWYGPETYTTITNFGNLKTKANGQE